MALGRLTPHQVPPEEPQGYAAVDDPLIYNGVGTYLRDARLAYGRTTAEIGAALRIKASHLDALEQGRTDGMAGLTYALGYLRSYAGYLGLDTEAVITAFKAELNREPEERPLVFPAPVQEAKFPTGRVLSWSIVLAVLVYGGYYYFSRAGTMTAEVVPPVPAELETPATGVTAGPTMAAPATPPVEAAAAAPAPVADPRSAQAAPAIVDPAPLTVVPGAPAVPGALPSVVPAPPGATPSPAAIDVVTPSATPAVPSAAPETTAPFATAAADPAVDPAAVAGDGRVVLRASAPAWVQIMGAGQEVIFTKILRAGDTYTVPARDDAVLVTGNAGALEVLVDGRSLGTLGNPGQVRRNVPLDPEKLLNGAARPPA